MTSPLQRRIQPAGRVDVYQRGIYDPSGDGAARTIHQGGQLRPLQPGMVSTMPVSQAANQPLRQDVMPRTYQTQGGLPMQGGQMQTTAMSGQPQYGLAGTENAIQAGVGAGVSAIEHGYQSALGQLNQARGDIQQAGNTAQGNIATGLNLLGNAGFQGQSAISQGVQQALGMLGGGGFASGAGQANASMVNPNAGQSLFQQAAQGVNQFTDAGVKAQQQQLALSGALGQGAFNDALMNNPATQFLKDEAMNAVMNQASATGGIGGANVLRALQDRASGLAAQDLDNQYNRAAMLSGQGLQAAGQAGQFLSQAGQQAGNLAATNAQLGTQASIASANNATQAGISNARNALQASMAGADIANRGGMSIANLLQGMAGQGAGLLGQGAALANSQGNQLAGLGQAGASMGMQGGLAAGQMFGNAGSQIGSARQQAGRDMSQNIGNTTSGLANLINQQGSGLSDILGQNGVNIANLLSGAGQSLGNQQMTLAQLLANLSTGQGTQLAGLQGQIGQAQANGIQGRANAINGTAMDIASMVAMFSDKRLKTNIKKIDERNGINIYQWDWNGLLGLTGKSIGVIAQEIKRKLPNAVSTHQNGYMMVDYAQVGDFINA